MIRCSSICHSIKKYVYRSTWLAVVLGAMICSMTIFGQAFASDVTLVEYGSNPLYDPPGTTDRAYYPCVLYDASQFSGHGTSSYYKMWYAVASGGPEAVVYSNDGISWSTTPVPITTLKTGGYHAKIVYLPGGYSAAGGTYYYKIWYWDSNYTYGDGTQPLIAFPLRTADSTDGVTWSNDQVLTQDAAPAQLVTGDPSNWSAGSYGPITIFYNSSALNTGSNPFDYTFAMYYDATTGGQEAIALAVPPHIILPNTLPNFSPFVV